MNFLPAFGKFESSRCCRGSIPSGLEASGNMEINPEFDVPRKLCRACDWSAVIRFAFSTVARVSSQASAPNAGFETEAAGLVILTG